MKYLLGLMFAVIGILVACQTTDPANNKSKEAPPSWNGSMKNLQRNLADIEPFLFDSEKFSNSYNLVGEKIHKMTVESKNLSHDPTLTHRDPTVKFVASQFAMDLDRADQSYSEGKTEYARYEIMKIASSCVQCHTRMQQGTEVNFSRTEPFLKSLSTVDQAEYLIASRKFQKAFETLTEALKEERPSDALPLRYERTADLALMIAVQYEQNPNMVIRLAEIIEGNKSLPYFIKAKTQGWKKASQSWKSEKSISQMTQVQKLELAEKLVGSKSEINSMRAVPLLLSILSTDVSKEQLGQSLFLTGVAYESLLDVSSMDIHENYYEACIRQVPHSDYGKKCYHNLQNSILVGYTGTSGTHLPLTTQMWLEKLKAESE
jgi:hypothetical protein